jgi:hypothetical protein
MLKNKRRLRVPCFVSVISRDPKAQLPAVAQCLHDSASVVIFRTDNLAAQKPEKLQTLAERLDRIREQGRSRP